MIKWGAVVDASDHDALVDYLSTNFSVEQAPYQAPRTSANRRFRRSRTRQEEFRRTPAASFRDGKALPTQRPARVPGRYGSAAQYRAQNLCQSMRRRMH